VSKETKMTTHTPRCTARHSGIWMAEPTWFQTTYSAFRAGNLPMLNTEEAEARSKPAASVTEDGIGLIDLSGMMMKGASKFGNVDTVAVRQQVRAMANAPEVRGIVLRIDSPGGTFAGTDDLANEVARAAKVKPVYAQVEDLAASAAYYVASQASAIFSHAPGQIGSIGTMLVVEDTSGAAEASGVKVHVIRTGEFKAAVVDGAPVTDGTLEYLNERIKQVDAFFQSAVKKGRGLTEKQLAAVSDGRVWFAEEAKALRLIDGVQSMDETVGTLRDDIKQRDKAAKTKTKMGMARLRG
jgi:signal peptide peptidase SppA